MKFPKRLSLNDAIYRLAVERQFYKPPKGLETCSGPLPEILDLLEERYETQICRNQSLEAKLKAQLEAIEELRTLAVTIQMEILDNAKDLTGSEADIEKLLKNPSIPYIDGIKLLRWAAQSPLNIRVRGMSSVYQTLAKESPIAATIVDTAEPEGATPPTSWEGVTLELRAANKLCVVAKDYRKTLDLENTGLIQKRNKQLTQIGVMLLQVAKTRTIPNPSRGKDAPQKLRTAMTKIRRELQKLTGITSDPFSKFSKTEGWMAHFKMDDKRNANEERERGRATHVPFDDNRDSQMAGEDYSFSDENDGAARFLSGESHSDESTDSDE